MFLLLSEIRQQLLAGKELTYEQAIRLLDCKGSETIYLFAVANEIREKYVGRKVDLCSIINARSGNCSEDCAFCSQSAHHRTSKNAFPFLHEEEIVVAAKRAEEAGASRFCIVTAGRGQENGKDFEKTLSALRRIKEETGLSRCCSLGIVDEEQIDMLIEAGISRYHHNLETAISFFPSICSTHSYEERVKTVKLVKKAGLEACCGGIIGMGETEEQRLELAFTLKEVRVDSIPLNILNPLEGTRLAGIAPLPPLEIIKTIAIFRLILPGKIIRYGGGRESNLRDLQSVGMIAGINGLLLGEYLTTKGRSAELDIDMIKDLNLS